jgi:hypothetical protein
VGIVLKGSFTVTIEIIPTVIGSMEKDSLIDATTNLSPKEATQGSPDRGYAIIEV